MNSTQPATADNGSIDLHTHSNASDGALTPAELMEKAAGEGVGTIALTDHDTLDGIEAAFTAAHLHGLQLVTGVEISVTWERRTLHIVGLAIDIENAELKAGLQRLQQTRRRRASHIAHRLEQMGVRQALPRIAEMADGGQITRTHFARLMVEDGLCANMQQCFQRYLKPGKRAHIRAQWAELGSAIGWIHAAGGIAVLAHPHAYKMTGAWRRRMYETFAQADGDATEICCGNSTADRLQTSAEDAERHHLLGSAGSDFHSTSQRWLRLGHLPTMPERITPVWKHPRFRTGIPEHKQV